MSGIYGEIRAIPVDSRSLAANKLVATSSVRRRSAIVEIGRPTLRVHDLRHTYASLARRADADLRLLQKTMGHASITLTAHIYAELDDVASALTPLTTLAGTFRKQTCRTPEGFGRILAG